MKRKPRILFLCTGNSCRSQMAEGFARALRGGVLDPFSAGLAPVGVNPRAVRAMAEAGVDISGQKSRSVAEFDGVDMDYVVTLCSGARESCPLFPARVRVLHVPFDDPPELAAGAPDEEAAMASFHRVRDEIREFILSLPGALGKKDGNPPG